ncbi:MAG: hypothetical protein EWV89_11470 [Microcystis wesenbergii Mw_QC_B_20070930_S4]|nr:MAG: hypothetical protein EWV73_14540 [Microcystis wesenbergii Mw_QC_B_20070930_S4D]TRV13271.1 MAG: hypothetical protein EWV89_11470 [Microcystis wesenbergii Mw_QC_B_20070930_S4]
MLILYFKKLLLRINNSQKPALLNQGMNANCAGSRVKVSWCLGFKNLSKEDSELKSATPLIFNLT